ncbi:hypothetical protein DYB32_003826 [Aphanomyces invadans]|uniref:Uncharacterized protein n=1 Tax=Aphanomyces invadans TaxID=157072 RepID=A0A418AZA5_9STRA|nr:hypothetical protein DYB32_003826 [Aphanomyces invadans]
MESPPPKRPQLTLALEAHVDDFSTPGFVWSYLTFFAAGATLVASWTCFVLSIDAFGALYPDGMVGFVFPVINMSSLLVITMFMLVAGRQLPLHMRMNGGFASLLLSVLTVPALQLAPNVVVQVRYVGTLVMVIVTSLASALIQSGKGTGALLLVVVRILTKWLYDHDEPGMVSLGVFFGFASVAIAIAWKLYGASSKLNLMKLLTFSPTETTPIVENPSSTDVGSILNVLRLAWKPVAMSFATFCICLACYPGLTTAIRSASFGPTWFPVVLTAAFTVGDVVGKSLPLTLRLLTLETLHYPLALQATFIPLFILAVSSHSVSGAAAITLVAALGLVTGYVGTSAMMLAPATCPDVEHEVAGMTGSLATIAGLFAGSYLGLVLQFMQQLLRPFAEEAELVAMQFSLAANRRNARDLDKLEATLLFKDHAPEFSPQEVKELFAGIEAKGSFQLNVNEYLEVRPPSVVGAGITLKTGDPGVNVLKEAIQNATTLSSDGTITFELFRQAIHDMNRKNQAAIAAGMMRMYRLKAKLQEQATKRRMSRGTASSIEVEYQVLVAQTERQQAELITVQNDLFSRVYGIIVAQYMCQTRVLHAFEAFFDHLHTEVDHSTTQMPPQRSPAYTDLCNFMDNHGPIFTNRAYRKIFLWYCLQGSLTNFQTIGRTSFLRFARDCRVADLSDRPVLDADLDACYVMALREPRVASPKQRVVDSESFHFHFKPTPLLFEHASKHSACAPGGGMTFKQWVHGTTLLLCRCLNIEVTLGRRYTPFDHCGLVQEWPSTQKADELFREYILPHANQLQTQPLGPEVSQPQVMQFILKHVWPLKQIFSHFGGHSMTSVP